MREFALRADMEYSQPTSRAFCSRLVGTGRADSLCYYSPVLLLIKDRKLMVYLPAGRQVPRLGYIRSAGTRHCERSEAELISDMSMRIYSKASKVENPLLCARPTEKFGRIKSKNSHLIRYKIWGFTFLPVFDYFFNGTF